MAVQDILNAYHKLEIIVALIVVAYFVDLFQKRSKSIV